MPDLKRQNKGQRLATAIYFITGFFEEKEPLRWQLRTLSLDLVGDKVKDKFNIVKEITALLSLAKDTNLVSDVNHNILTQELSKLEEEAKSPFIKTFFDEMTREEMTLPQPERAEAIKDKSSKEPKELGAWSRPSVKKKSRQSIIIGLLKRKKEIMIKDVLPLISGYSGKTIQRELLAMVSSGILKKIGEKRWSRYSLAHA